MWCQDFADQAVLKMPEVMHANLVYLEAFRQMRANRFHKLPDAPAELAKWFGQLGFHILSSRCDHQNLVTLQQERMPILINEAFVGGSDPFKALQQGIQALNVVWTSRQQGIMRNHAQPRDAQTQLEAVVVQILGRTVPKIGFGRETTVSYSSGENTRR